MEEHFPDDTEAERATRLISSVVACIQRLVGRIEEYQGEYFVLHLAVRPLSRHG
jgi:recombinational DNA repair protein RecR